MFYIVIQVNQAICISFSKLYSWALKVDTRSIESRYSLLRGEGRWQTEGVQTNCSKMHLALALTRLPISRRESSKMSCGLHRVAYRHNIVFIRLIAWIAWEYIGTRIDFSALLLRLVPRSSYSFRKAHSFIHTNTAFLLPTYHHRTVVNTNSDKTEIDRSVRVS